MSSNAPRRYVVDGMGRHVLVGLTFDETLEFEHLDSRQLDRLEASADSTSRNDIVPVDQDLRWLELYTKHDSSWKRWVAVRRTDRSDNFNILKRKKSF